MSETMTGVREYAEEYPVELREVEEGRLVIQAWNESRHNFTQVDLLDLIAWLKKHKPELLDQAPRS
jgi:hypothetical protein